MVRSCRYSALSVTFSLRPTQLTMFNTASLLASSLFSPLAGVLGDRYHRGIIIAIGTLVWSAASALFGLSLTFSQAVAWIAISGVGTALVSPASSSILADMFPESSRGTAFGILFFISNVGSMAGGAWAINAANKDYGQLAGWRLTFFISAGLGLVTALFAFPGIWEPRRNAAAAGPAAVHDHVPAAARWHRPKWAEANKAALRIACDCWQVVRVPSFLVLLVEHVTDLTSGAGGFAVQYNQFLGFSDAGTSAIVLACGFGGAVGLILGGISGDLLARRFPIAARPLSNQISIALVMPLIYVGYKVMPGCSKYATGVSGTMDYLLWKYALLNFVLGALQSWCAANNSTIYAEVIPPQRRSLAYALDLCISGIVNACTIPVAGLAVERYGGHTATAAATAGGTGDDGSAPAPAVPPSDNLANARAIEDGLLLVILVSFGIKLFVYAMLYWTMPRDRLLEEEEEGAAPLPPLAPAPSAVELLRASSTQTGLLAALPTCPGLPPPPCSSKATAGNDVVASSC
ncbi:hypothetical protein WJX81_007741 [Elliptochloris bilobata]|uniref:Major facilitator superfamily (MFS) profile domain-containing protein n=1 Tax=Elliptochloris bilobata TaxID=381761 RepID=A0AAW1SBE1_9CHLO